MAVNTQLRRRHVRIGFQGIGDGVRVVSAGHRERIAVLRVVVRVRVMVRLVVVIERLLDQIDRDVLLEDVSIIVVIDSRVSKMIQLIWKIVRDSKLNRMGHNSQDVEIQEYADQEHQRKSTRMEIKSNNNNNNQTVPHVDKETTTIITTEITTTQTLITITKVSDNNNKTITTNVVQDNSTTTDSHNNTETIMIIITRTNVPHVTTTTTMLIDNNNNRDRCRITNNKTKVNSVNNTVITITIITVTMVTMTIMEIMITIISQTVTREVIMVNVDQDRITTVDKDNKFRDQLEMVCQ